MKAAAVEKGEFCQAGTSTGAVIPVDIAAAKAVAIARPIADVQRLPLMQSAGRILAHDLVARMHLPPFDNSAMDGYALKITEMKGDGPWEFDVAGRVAAGQVYESPTREFTALRVFTGAFVPPVFGAVVMQERCERIGDRIVVRNRPRPDENIRRAGEDVRAGDPMLAAGDCLTPQRLALISGQGLAEVDVLRKVRIGLMSTGSELQSPGETLLPGHIYNSNRVMIHSMLLACPWAEVIDFGIVPDSRVTLARAFGDAVRTCDVLVTTGGVSAGEEDHVVSALGDHGGTLEVLKVAMRPGKPVKVGLIGKMLFVGLPGNPNAAFVTFRQIALPAIRAIAGMRNVALDWQPAVAGFCYRKVLGRTEFIPVRRIGRDERGLPVIEMLERGSSASLSAMALADGIAMLPPETTLIEAGAPITFEAIGFG
ncbi:molybdenum cofactor biosynthesis protein [Aminobacter sp. DSM 101952]|uniref:molybdopterin molybdotransferase MoeA n=1 Tax=unclassified Aminobacter TaxID=2644704 RepID=UPI0006F55696|nr:MULTISPECIES: gephyrin-like molybdotransferase Glp [unclassified Aminobacter]AWC23678.1 Molybdopterin molybdenumtransferase [Aminobacter sp. MSH1]KQU70093.1 molybdenum cofactor biosynthesis protein [Aminobacter sp. DSM 101952]